MLRIVFRDKNDDDHFAFIEPLLNSTTHPTPEGAYNRLLAQLQDPFLIKEPPLGPHKPNTILCAIRRTEISNKANIVIASHFNKSSSNNNNNNSKMNNNHQDHYAATDACFDENWYSIRDDLDACNIAIDDILLVMKKSKNIPDHQLELFDESNTHRALKATRFFEWRTAANDDRNGGTSTNKTTSNNFVAHGAATVRGGIRPIEHLTASRMSQAPAITVEELFSFNPESKQDCDRFRSLLKEAKIHSHMFVDITSSPELSGAVDNALKYIKDFFDWPVLSRVKMQMDSLHRAHGWNLMKHKRKDMLKIRLTDAFEYRWKQAAEANDPVLSPSLEDFYDVYDAMHTVGAKLVSNMYKLAGMKGDLSSDQRKKEVMECPYHQQRQQNRRSTQQYSLSLDEQAFFDIKMNCSQLNMFEQSLSSFFECFRYNNFCDLEGSGHYALPCEEHGDVGMTTISCESSTGTGLQVRSRQHGWQDVEMRMKHERVNNGRKYLSVMFGDMLNAASNYDLDTSPHQVVMPSNIQEPRYSFIVEAIPYPTEMVHQFKKGALFGENDNDEINKNNKEQSPPRKVDEDAAVVDDESLHDKNKEDIITITDSDADNDNDEEDCNNRDDAAAVADDNNNSTACLRSNNTMKQARAVIVRDSDFVRKTFPMLGKDLFMDCSKGRDSVNWSSPIYDGAAGVNRM